MRLVDFNLGGRKLMYYEEDFEHPPGTKHRLRSFIFTKEPSPEAREAMLQVDLKKMEILRGKQ